jgi:transcriptional regulator with XRE-family HTH domain
MIKKINTTGEAIKFYREKIMTQEKLAELLNCQQPEIANYETDKKLPEIPRWIEMCKILNMPTYYYFINYMQSEPVNFVAEQEVHSYLSGNPLPENIETLELLNLVFQSKKEENKGKLINSFKILLHQPDEKLEGVTKILAELIQYVVKPE